MRYGILYRGATPGTPARPALRHVRLREGSIVSVAVHDVAPATQERCERLIDAASRRGMRRFTLLVVPRYHGQPATAAFERWLETRRRLGDELVLHGFTHRDDVGAAGGLVDRLLRRWYTAGEGEFAALDAGMAGARLAAGRSWFAVRGWSVRGFVPPAWLLGATAWQALAAQPFDYTCTLRDLICLGESSGRSAAERVAPLDAARAWSIVYSTRSAWRRSLSLAWTTALLRAQRGAPWIRLELHPADAEFASIERAAMRAIEQALAEGREPLTLAGVADRVVAAARSAARATAG